MSSDDMQVYILHVAINVLDIVLNLCEQGEVRCGPFVLP